MSRTGWATALAIIFTLCPPQTPTAEAHGGEKHTNLKIVPDAGKAIGRGMKRLSKGLGVKCTKCHIKGKLDSDDLAAKISTRRFLQTVWNETDEQKRAEALDALLASLEVGEARHVSEIWAAIATWKKATKKKLNH